MKLLGRRLANEDAHAAGLALLRELYGGPLPQIQRTDRGKPYFVDSKVHFSISHSKGHVFCALSDKPIGIDCEEKDRIINLSLAEKILSPMELVQFREAEEKRLALLKFWVLKEAAAKCSGEGLRGYPNHTAFSLEDPRVQKLAGCMVAVIQAEAPQVEDADAL